MTNIKSVLSVSDEVATSDFFRQFPNPFLEADPSIHAVTRAKKIDQTQGLAAPQILW
jgi:hypothetical protein